MIAFIVLPLLALGAYALGGLDYLRRLLLPPAPSTTGVSAPYVPPFLGGQCAGTTYNFTYTRTVVSSPFGGEGTSVDETRTDLGNTVIGPIRGIEYGIYEGYSNFRILHSGGILVAKSGGGKYPANSAYGPTSYSFSNIVFTPESGQPNNCGNLENPNASPSPSTDGLADSGSPNLDNSDVVLAGLPVVAIPNFLPALLAALNAARQALNALDAIKSIADAIEAISDLLKNLKDGLDKDKEKDDEGNKEISRYNFGSISSDGYLRLYPASGLQKKKAVYLDLQVLSFPIGYGKYFGRKSPHFYRFKSLGHIAFTSPTFGVMEVRSIEFSRTSFPIPDNATGFYYHLGLDGAIVANASGYYQEIKKVAV